MFQWSFKEVFLDYSATLKKEINFVFIEHNDNNHIEENRNIIIVKFEYDTSKTVCQHLPVHKKKHF